MSEASLRVHVNRLDEPALGTEAVERAVRETAGSEGYAAGEFSVTFVDEKGMAELNCTYLGRTGATDVVAFDLGDDESPLGDIYICPAVARGSAQAAGVALREELLRLVVHGVLHVLGHDHPEGEERSESEMFRRQEAIVSRLI